MIHAPVITIDGPGGSGKSTLCKAMAKELKWNILDSGTIYRVLAFSALYNKINLYSEKELSLIASNLNVKFVHDNNTTKIIFEKKDITKEIYNKKISITASKIAILPLVRQSLLFIQRSFRKFPGLIANGRDMGTVVFVDAIVKIFLDANLEVRAQRRMLQLKKNGLNNIRLKNLLSELDNRDKRDRTRLVSPMIPAKDALILDSTRIDIQKIIDKSLKFTLEKIFLSQK